MSLKEIVELFKKSNSLCSDIQYDDEDCFCTNIRGRIQFNYHTVYIEIDEEYTYFKLVAKSIYDESITLIDEIINLDNFEEIFNKYYNICC